MEVGRGGERESLTGMYTECNHGDRLPTRSGGLLRYYGNKPPLHQSRQFFFLAAHPTALAGGELTLESGSNKPVITQNSESHSNPRSRV